VTHPPTLGQRAGRAAGAVFGEIPGWYMLAVEPFVRTSTGTVRARSRSGAVMDLDLSEFVQRKHWFRSYERNEIRFIHRFVRPGDVVVDVGANVGVLATEAARAVGPTGRVIAIEPVPSNAAVLRANAALDPRTRIEVIESAVGASAGVLGLGIDQLQRSVGNQGAYTAIGGTAVDIDTVVPLARLDDLLAHRLAPNERVRLLKVDVEGMEASVFEGAEELLASRRVDAVMFERNLTLTTTQPGDVLRRHGFTVQRLGSFGRVLDTSPLIASAATDRVDTGRRSDVIVNWYRGNTRLTTLIASPAGRYRRDQ
jgi:FkbM family methyltransferase